MFSWLWYDWCRCARLCTVLLLCKIIDEFVHPIIFLYTAESVPVYMDTDAIHTCDIVIMQFWCSRSGAGIHHVSGYYIFATKRFSLDAFKLNLLIHNTA